MRQKGFGLFVLAIFLLQSPLLRAQDEIRDLVVKIHTVRRTPNVLRPWTSHTPQNVKGSGVVIKGNVILTNAHVVRYASQIYVQPNQSARRYSAQVAAIAPGIDLAILRLEDESFFDNRGSIAFADELPRVKDTVNVYGYPTGGSELSVTQGIVSRIEFTDYYYSAMGLRIQVDAALNFGNSGGPAVSNGKLVGLVFSLIQNAQSIGFLIPVEEIQLFLADIADGVYNGKPRINDFLQTIENNALRQKLGLAKEAEGIMVVEPYQLDGGYPLREWDVITRIGQQPIDSDGKVAVRYDLRLSAQYLVQKLAHNGSIELTVLRDGETNTIKLPVNSHRELVIPYLMNNEPRYFIYGPLVFSQATQDYIERLGGQREISLSKQGSPLMTRRFARAAFAGEEIVVVASPLFPHRINKGYDDPNNSVLTEVNGKPIKNLRHLVEVLRDLEEPQVIFKFAKNVEKGQETLVFNRAEIAAATEEILEENGIRHQYSPELRSVWEKPLTRLPKPGAGS